MTDDKKEEEKEFKEIKEKVEESLSVEELYYLIYDVISTYMDMRHEDKVITSLWIMACSVKDSFLSFPYLFINASKGSGKTRLLKLMNCLIPNSKLTSNLTESALFRLPAQQQLNALLIDEAERMSSREKANLRELLNVAYKKGGKVLRTEKIDKEHYEVKEYEVYMGVALANIFGLESVLEDRCITIILDKSNNPLVTKIPEYFEFDERIERIKKAFLVYEVYVGSIISNIQEYVYKLFLHDTLHTLPSLYTLHTQFTYLPEPILHTQPTQILPFDIDKFYETLKKSEITGRDLELWFPLFTIAAFISEDFLESVIEIALKKIKEKRQQEVIEDRDTIFMSFLYCYLKANNIEDMISIRKLRSKFFEYEGEKSWLSSEWIGRFLRRTNVVTEKRRLARGIEVKINLEKVKDFLDKRGIEVSEETITSYIEEYEPPKDLSDFG